MLNRGFPFPWIVNAAWGVPNQYIHTTPALFYLKIASGGHIVIATFLQEMP
jgi:hypothetical protein